MHPSAQNATAAPSERRSVWNWRQGGRDGRRGGPGTARIIVEFLAFTVLVVVTALLLRPLQENLLRRMVELRDSAISAAESRIGRNIEYRSMGPSIFGTLDLREVSIVGSDGVVLASISRLRVGYSIVELLSGGGLGSLRTISLDRPVVNLDTQRDADLLSRPSGGSIFTLLKEMGDAPRGLRVRLRGASVSWRDDRSSLSLSNLSLTATAREGRIALDTGAAMTASLSAPFSSLGSIHTVFRMKGEVASGLDSGSLTFALPSFSSDLAVLRPQTILVAFSKRGAEIRKIKGRAPFDLTARYDFASGTLTADLLAEKFSPHDVLYLRGPLAGHDVWLDSRISGSVSLKIGEEISYRVNLTGKLPDSGPFAGAEASFIFKGNAAEAVISNASVRSERGDAVYTGKIGFFPLRPEGKLSFAGIQLRDAARLDADFEIASEGNDTTFFADRLSIGDVAFSAVNGRVHPERESYAFNVSALRFSGTEGYEDVRLAHLAAEGSFSISEPFLQFSLSADAFSAGEALGVAGAFVGLPSVAEAALLKDIPLTTEVFVTTDFKHVSYNAPRVVVAYRGGADVFSVASVSGTDARLDIRDIRVIWKGGSAGGSVSVDFHDPSELSFSARADYRNIPYRIDGSVLDGRTMSLEGNYGLSGSVIIAEEGNFSGVLSVKDVPIPMGDRRLSASANASFRWGGIHAWALVLDELRIDDASGLSSRGARAALRGAIDQNGAVFPQVSIDDGQGVLSGNARFSWPADYGSLTASAKLADALGSERYEIEGAVSREELTARLYLSRGHLERFVPNPYEATGTGELRLRWSKASDYEASWRISEIKAKVQGEELLLSGSGTLSSDILDLEEVRLSYTGMTADIASLHVDRPKRNADASFRIRGAAIGSEADIIARARLSFSPMNDWSALENGYESLEGTIDVTRARLGSLEAKDPFRISVQKDGAQFSLTGGPNDAIRFKTDGEGAFYAAFSAPAPVRGTLMGTIAHGEIDAQANNIYLDFAALWRFIPLDVISFNGGIAVGSLSVKGPLGDPEFTGSAHATGVRLVVPDWVNEEIGPANVDVDFIGDAFTFGPVAAPVGTGSGIVTAKFSFDRWIPSSFVLNVEVPKSNPIKTKADVAGVVARGTATGNIRIERSDAEVGVTGLITAESATIMMDPERFRTQQAEASAPDPYPVHVALSLRTGRKVEFAWPSTDLPVLRVSATPGNSLGINYDGLSGRFALKGDVFLRGGEVFYFQRSFYVREGAIRFNENEVRMDPSLSVRAEIRDTYQGGPVTIALIVDDAPLSTFTPRLESDPPLSQLEIFSLLGQNLVNVDSQTGSASVQDSLLLASSDILAQFNVIRRFESNARDVLGLDMFSVRTQVLQNAVLDVTGLRSVPVDRIGGLGNYFDNTTVYLGKYIGSDFFVQAMLSLRYEETKADNLFGGLNLEPDMGIELKTPLFLVRWSFLPEHPENIFVNDNSFTITWKKSF